MNPEFLAQENPKYKEDLGKGAISIFIKYGMKKRTMCYAEESHRGWCGVCDKRAKEGQHGYCDFFGETERLSTLKNNWKHLGRVCSKKIGIISMYFVIINQGGQTKKRRSPS